MAKKRHDITTGSRDKSIGSKGRSDAIHTGRSSIHKTERTSKTGRFTVARDVSVRGSPLPPRERGRSYPVRPSVRPASAPAAPLAGTDWERVDAMSEADIRRQIREDSDVVPEVTDEMLRRAQWHPAPKKTPISFRVDPDILEYYRAKGPGYQSRMNAALRAIMEYEQGRGESK